LLAHKGIARCSFALTVILPWDIPVSWGCDSQAEAIIMYVLETLIAGHRDIVEQEYFLTKLVNWSGSERSFIDGVNKASGYFGNEVRQHMQLEEKVLFPVMKKVLPADKRHIISNLEAEHKAISEKQRMFGVEAAALCRNCNPEIKKNLADLSKEILKIVIPHARREYEILAPLINAYFKSDDYKEVEDLYFKFIKT
jgi:hemerythrin-like domain-containing protein